MRYLTFILSFVAYVGTAMAQTVNSPVEVVAALYKPYLSAGAVPEHKGVFTKKLLGLIEADEKATPEGQAGRLDWDVFIDGNDWELKDFEIQALSEAAETAAVVVRFKNFGELREIRIDLVLEDGVWKIDEVQSILTGARWTMSKILTGAPDAFPDEPPAEGEVNSDGGGEGVGESGPVGDGND